ncbi:MAG: efflux RND transporter permease subunit [Bacteroidota bacterium]|nr:efflux RND transporter permease subunit [Bacteroidota bacterium]
MSLYSFSRNHSKAIIFFICLLALLGIYTSTKMPISIFPNIDFPRIVIIAESGEEPADRIMVTITKPLEEAINSVPGVRNVRSVTTRGSAEISINFDWGTDIILTQLLLQSKIAAIRNTLPSDAEIQINRMNATFFPIIGYELTSDTRSQVELRDFALYTIRPALSRINGIAQIPIVGGRTREFLVTIDPQRITSYNIDIRHVSDILSKTNSVKALGLIDANYKLYLTLSDNMLKTSEEIGNIVISTQGGTPIFLKDIAKVSISEKDEYIKVTGNGKEAVLVNIVKQPEGNTLQIAKDVNKILLELKKQIPADIKIQSFYDQSDLISDSFSSVRDSIAIGVVLAIIVMLLFLRNWRITIIAAVIIPTTVAITIILLNSFKETLNIMTLGGIAAAIGLILDDTIVIVENIFRHFHKNKQNISSAVKDSIKELLPAVLGSSASTIVIFIPFAFLGGVTGAFFKSLALTMALALFVSLILSLILAPILATKFVKGIDTTQIKEHEGFILKYYNLAVTFLLKHRLIIIPFVILLVGISIYVFTLLGSGFMPEMDEGAFILDYLSPSGTSLNETNRMLSELEKYLLTIPEVESYSRRTGTQLGFFITEPNNGDYLIKLKKNRTRSSEEIINDIRSKVGIQFPALQIEFGALIGDLIGDLTNVPSPIEIKIFGDNKELIHQKAKETAKIISSVKGVVDVSDGIVISGPAYIINYDQEAIGRAGLLPIDIQETLENSIQGIEACQIQKGEKVIGVRVRLADEYRFNIEKLKTIGVPLPNGGSVPLNTFATVKIDPGQSEIERENLKQMIAVTARISGRDLGSTVQDVKKELNKNLVAPKEISIQYGGTYETQQESFRDLLLVLLAASLLVLMVLVIEFESFFISVSIFFVALLSLSGVVFALFVTGIAFNISSFMGAIMIVGIVAENSIFLVHYFKKYQTTGLSPQEAILKACHIRTRPIIMTTLAAIFALLPLALGLGAGAQMQQPLAIAVIGGFSISSILLLFILPVLLSKYKFALIDKKDETT